MSDKELWKLMSIICEGQDSEQRRKVEQYITDLQKENKRLNNIIKEAIKYIKEITSDGYIIVDDLNYYDIPELLRILQGSDKE